jgi:hypothetical protein
MKTNQFVIIIMTFLFMMAGIKSFAQRRVMNTPRQQ